MGFKSLNDTFIYQNLNNNGSITKVISKVLQSGKILTTKNLEEAFLIINKNFKFPLKYKVMEEVENGNIRLVFSPDNMRMTTCMPFFLTRNSQGEVIAVVLVDMYGNMNKENGNVTIDPKKFYTILESAYFAKLCYLYGDQISTRNIIITNGSSIYSNMFTRVLNKKYALNVDKNKMQKVLLAASKFYLLNILGLKDTEMTLNYALKNCVNGNLFLLKEFNDFRLQEGKTLQKDFEMRIAAIKDFLKEIEKIEPGRIKTLKGRLTKSFEDLEESALLDKNRFEQELIYYLEKIDITEEKVRLRSHLAFFLETMKAPESNGKKLGFILQEIGREINTIGSKANDAMIQRHVVGMKDELEKLKEQSANII